jgi:hypothetical protein
MFEIAIQEPPAVSGLREEAKAIAQLRLYGDDCVLMGWTGNYRNDAPVAVFLSKADDASVSHPKAVTVLLEETQSEVADWRLKYGQGASPQLAEFLSATCPDLARRFPGVFVADGDEPITPEQFHAKMLTFTIRLP